MSNSCNQTSTHQNTTENAENIGWVKNTLLLWSRFGCTGFLKDFKWKV